MKCWMLAVCLLIPGFPPDDAKDASKKDLEKMQGDWAAFSMVRDGIKFPDDDAQCLFRTVKDQTYTVFRFDKQVGKGTIAIDGTKSPRTIDAVPETAAGKAPQMLGIYEFDGEKLKICFAPPGQPRPKDFTCGMGSGHTLTVWEREKKK